MMNDNEDEPHSRSPLLPTSSPLPPPLNTSNSFKNPIFFSFPFPSTPSSSLPYSHLTPSSSSPSKSSLCCFKHCQKRSCCYHHLFYYSFQSNFHFSVCILMSCIILCLLFAVIVPLFFRYLEVIGISDEIVIDSSNAPSYNLWQSNIYGNGEKRPIYYDLYIFDVQNPIEALRGEKPILVQVGPYGFMNYYNKFDIHWSDGGDTVQYRLQTFYCFSSERSGPGLSINDSLTLAYPSALGFEYILQGIPLSAQELLDAAVTSKINSKIDAIDEIIQTRIQAIIDNPFMDPVTKNQTLTKLYHLDTLLRIIEVVGETNSFFFSSASSASSSFP